MNASDSGPNLTWRLGLGYWVLIFPTVVIVGVLELPERPAGYYMFPVWLLVIITFELLLALVRHFDAAAPVRTLGDYRAVFRGFLSKFKLLLFWMVLTVTMSVVSDDVPLLFAGLFAAAVCIPVTVLYLFLSATYHSASAIADDVNTRLRTRAEAREEERRRVDAEKKAQEAQAAAAAQKAEEERRDAMSRAERDDESRPPQGHPAVSFESLWKSWRLEHEAKLFESDRVTPKTSTPPFERYFKSLTLIPVPSQEELYDFGERDFTKHRLAADLSMQPWLKHAVPLDQLEQYTESCFARMRPASQGTFRSLLGYYQRDLLISVYRYCTIVLYKQMPDLFAKAMSFSQLQTFLDTHLPIMFGSRGPLRRDEVPAALADVCEQLDLIYNKFYVPPPPPPPAPPEPEPEPTPPPIPPTLDERLQELLDQRDAMIAKLTNSPSLDDELRQEMMEQLETTFRTKYRELTRIAFDDSEVTDSTQVDS